MSQVGPVRHQAARLHILANAVHRGEAVPRGEGEDCGALSHEHPVRKHDDGLDPLRDQCGEGALDASGLLHAREVKFHPEPLGGCFDDVQ